MAEYNALKLVNNCLLLDLGKAKGHVDLSSLSGSGGGTWGTITGTLPEQTDLQTALDLKANTSVLSAYLTTASAGSTYQPILVSGTSIKTINSASILGSGNIIVAGDATLAGTQTWTGVNTFSPTTTLSTGSVNLEGFYPTVNQSGNAGYVARRVSVYEQATGSGSKLLLDLGTNSAANGSGTHTSKFSVNKTGTITTGNILIGGSGDGAFVDNAIYRSGIGTYITGNAVGGLYLRNSQTAGGVFLQLSTIGLNTVTSPQEANIINTIAGSSVSSGTYTAYQISTTINQTGTAGYTALKINTTETTTGSGTKLLADFQVGGVSKFKISNTGYATFASDVDTPQFYRIGGVAIHTVIGSNLYHYAGGNGHIFVDGFGGTTLAQINAGGRFMLGNFTDNGVDILQITGTSKFTGNVTVAGDILPSDNTKNLGGSTRWASLQMNGGINFYGGTTYNIKPESFSTPSGVAFAATIQIANASAIVDIQSTTKGFLPPRMTTTQKNAISSPAKGLIVFDDTLAKICFFNGSGWETVTSTV